MSTPLPDPPTFEHALGELDRIVHDLEDGTLGLEESLARYEQGVGLLKRCHAELQRAEQRILLLSAAEGDGKPALQPFGHEASAEPPPRAVTPRRPRSRTDDGSTPF
jgi:exodeoxyribonuclease VII small subunit